MKEVLDRIEDCVQGCLNDIELKTDAMEVVPLSVLLDSLDVLADTFRSVVSQERARAEKEGYINTHVDLKE